MDFRPLYDRILVKRVAAETQTKGGIFIPDTAQKEKPIEGTVVAIGNGKLLDDGSVRPIAVKPGDKVLFGKYSGTEIKAFDEDHVVIREDDILGVLS